MPSPDDTAKRTPARVIQIDGFPKAFIRKDKSVETIFADLSCSFHINTRRKSKHVVDGWGFRRTWVYSFSVGFARIDGLRHVSYINDERTFPSRHEAMEAGREVAVAWLFADDRRWFWEQHLRSVYGLRQAKREIENVRTVMESIVGTSSW